MAETAGGMRCPVDGTALVMSERSGIEIDYCPACRGVWLDRGELDKIIERSDKAAVPVSQPQRSGDPWRSDPRSHGSGHDYGHRKRKKSFLQELFD